ncbi:hypothetical protein SprV_0301170000 [Sparganum proliferum]
MWSLWHSISVGSEPGVAARLGASLAAPTILLLLVEKLVICFVDQGVWSGAPRCGLGRADVPTSATITTCTPTSSNVDPVHTCPHCDRLFASHIDLVGHLRIQRTQTGDPVPGAPIYMRRILLRCPHYLRTFTYHMRIRENLRSSTAGCTTLSHFPHQYPQHHPLKTSNCHLQHSDIIELRPGQIISAECTSLCESQAQTVHFKVGDVYLPQKPFPRHSRSPSPIVHNFKTAQPAVHNSLYAGIRDLPTSSLDGKWFSCWPFFKVQANRFHRFWQNCWTEVYRNPSTNLEQLLLTLGTVSNVCFVDKKGILSFSIPTPDKVFFFRNPTQHRKRLSHSTVSFNYKHIHHHRSFSSTPQFPLTRKPRCNSQKESRKDSGLSETRCPHKSSVDFGTRTIGHPINDQNSGPRPFLQSTNSPLTPLTLDVTTPSEFIYTLHFVTPRWHHFLGSLKPIGLSLLLNNCQQHTREHYVEFADHLMAMTASLRQQAVRMISVADSNDSTGHTNPAQVDDSGETVAVVNSRCLCGLAYKIGFQRTVLDLFSFVASVGIFKPIEQQLIGQQSFRPPSGTFTACVDFCSNFRASERSLLKDGTRALHIQEAYACAPKDAFREPIPMPNCFCVIARGRSGAGYQVFTQGSADLVSTLCENVWDGREILPLTEADRGRILDFYNRNVSTAYCIAFSYTPLLRSLPLLPSRPPASIPGDTCGEECTHASGTKPVKSVVLELPVVS